VALVEVTPLPSATPPTAVSAEIHVAGKVVVVPADVDAAALRRVLAVLEEAA
jgi:hypothetical protein